jgi:Pyruvate/2-oxoacid:ferredoxin oxidoreductase gamma subunit
MITGVGGQGVQLAAQVLARAAVLEGRHVMMLGLYGGTMRGGNTDSTIVVADAPIESPPIVSRTGSAIAMHHEFWEPLRARLRPRAVVLINAGLFEGEVDCAALRVTEVPATRIASELGIALAGSLVMVGAYAGITQLVGIDSLVLAMEQSLPPYRRQHAPANTVALRAGFDAVPRATAPAWQES